MTALLHGLVGDIADGLRSGLPAGLAAANDDDNAGLVAELTAAGLLDEPELVALLLRCADEERITGAVRSRSDSRGSRFLQGLVGDEDAAVSAAAMAVILARGRRRDRFGQPCIEFDDLPASTVHALVQAVAAALRRRLAGAADPEAADAQLAQASAALLSRHDPKRCLESTVTALVKVLDSAAKLDSTTLEAAVEDGDVAFLAAALGHLAELPGEVAWDHLVGGSGGRAMLLLRIAGTAREFAARLLAGSGELLGMPDPVEEIARFDSLGEDEVAAARAWLRLDPNYRRALSALEGGRGQSAV